MTQQSKPTPPKQPSDVGPWKPLGNGRYVSQSTGMLKYVPAQDPKHPCYGQWMGM